MSESAIDFPVKESQINIMNPKSIIDHIHNELSKYNGYLDYEDKYEKRNELEIGFDIKLAFGLDISTTFASEVSSLLEKGIFSGDRFKTYPLERAKKPTDSCNLQDLLDNIILPAINAVKDSVFHVAEVVGQKTVEVMNVAANSVLKLVSKGPISTVISYWCRILGHLSRSGRLESAGVP